MIRNLTGPEVHDRALKLATAIDDLRAAEDAKQAAVKEHNARIAAAREHVDRLARAVRERQEDATQVDLFDPTTGEVRS